MQRPEASCKAQGVQFDDPTDENVAKGQAVQWIDALVFANVLFGHSEQTDAFPTATWPTGHAKSNVTAEIPSGQAKPPGHDDIAFVPTGQKVPAGQSPDPVG